MLTIMNLYSNLLLNSFMFSHAQETVKYIFLNDSMSLILFYLCIRFPKEKYVWVEPE